MAIHAVVLDDERELVRDEATVDAQGRASGAAENARCVADARERLAFARGGNSGGTSGTPTPGGVTTPTPTAPTMNIALVPTEEVVAGVTVLQLKIPDGARRIRVRLWSNEPNDLEGVMFGLLHVVWRPNVSEADWHAWINRPPPPPPPAPAPRPARVKTQVVVKVDVEAERRREAARQARLQAAAERREREERDQAIRAEQRRIFCDSHPDDRGCWGPGGLKLKLALDARATERETYCNAHREDARCWSDADFSKIRQDDHLRVLAAQTPSKPTTPPPAPLAESQPPKLSAHAEWRPGYWHWIENTWVWLAGQWRVPEQDIIAEQTTTAPAAPPALQAETPPPAPPVQAAFWVSGFWQWDGAAWIWVPGSWQLRPSTTLTWRATTWQPRGGVHILVPGGWVRR